MAKGRGTNNNDKSADDIIASNREVIKQLNEISSQSVAAFNIAKEAVLEFKAEIDSLSDVLSEQCEKVKCFEQMASSLDSAKDGAKDFTNAISKQIGQTKKLAESLGFKKSGTGYAKKQNIFEDVASSSRQAKIAVLALSSAFKVLQSAAGIVKGVFSTITGVIGTMISIITTGIKTIINFGTKLYEGLFDMANQYLAIINEINRKREEIRDKFGDTSKSIGSAVVRMSEQLFAGGAAGLSGMQLFKDAAEAYTVAIEMAESGGAAFEKLVDQFSGRGVNNLYAYMKGLGLTVKEFGDLTRLSTATGVQMEDMYKNMLKFASGFTKQFGGSMKGVARDMARARIDVKHFANVSDRELGIAAVYARQLGVELENIVGVMDAFDTFDAATERVSRLSQAFGMNLNVMSVMKSKTPAEMLDKLRTSFFATGRSVEDLNYREVKYLATQAQISEQTAMQVFSMKNRGVAIDTLTKKSLSLEQKTLNAQEAMVELMGQIPRHIRDITNESKGFFSTFFDGFAEGIALSGRFRGTMMSMAEAIKRVKEAGRTVGAAFLEYFPGVKEMLQSISILMPKVGGLFEKYAASIRAFFQELRAGSQTTGQSVQGIFSRLKKDTKNFFYEAGPAGGMFAEGASMFFSTIGRIFEEAAAHLLNRVTDLLANMLHHIADWLEDSTSSTGGLFRKAGSKIGDALGISGQRIEESPLTKAMVRFADRMGGPLGRIVDNIGERFIKFFETHKLEIAAAIGGILSLAIGNIVITMLPSILARNLPRMLAPLMPGAPAAAAASRSLMTNAAASFARSRAGDVLRQGGRGLALSLGTSESALLRGYGERLASSKFLQYAKKPAAESVEAIIGLSGRKVLKRVSTKATEELGEKIGVSLIDDVAKGAAKGITTQASTVGVKTVAAAAKGAAKGMFTPGAILGIAGSVIGEMQIQSGDYRTGELFKLGGSIASGASMGAMVGGPLGAVVGGIIAGGIHILYDTDEFKAHVLEGISKEDYLKNVSISPDEAANAVAEGLVEKVFEEADEISRLVAIRIDAIEREDVETAQRTSLDIARKLMKKRVESMKGFTEHLGDFYLSEEEVDEAFSGEFLTHIQAVISSMPKLDESEVSNYLQQRRIQSQAIAQKLEGSEGVELFEQTIAGTLQGFQITPEELTQLMAGYGSEYDRLTAKLKDAYGDEDQRAIILQGLAMRHLNLSAERSKDMRTEIEQKQKEIASEQQAALDSAERAKMQESTLRHLGISTDQEINAQALEARFKEISNLHTKVMGGGAEDIAKKISEMRTKLAGIDFDILGFDKVGEDKAGYEEVDAYGNVTSVAPTVSQLVPRKQRLQEAFEGLRILTGVFMLIGGLGDAGAKAGLSLKKFGSAQKQGDPAWWLTTGTGDMKKAMSNLSLLTTDMAEIVKKWKTDFMVVSLDSFAAQVDKLASNAQRISAGIYDFHNALERFAPEEKITQGYGKLIKIVDLINTEDAKLGEKLTSEFGMNLDAVLGKLDAVQMRSIGPGRLGGTSGVEIGKDIRINIHVEMAAGAVANAIVQDYDNLVVKAIEEATPKNSNNTIGANKHTTMTPAR